jgi:outer membrane lipoprotein SlyB
LIVRFALCVALAAGVAGCGPDYSPNTYASNAVQQANKVDQGVVVGVRQVDVSASGTVGTVTGAAAGGIAGAQVASGATSAFTALGGSLVGGIAGAAAEHATSDTKAFEYIVRKTNGDLLSVTQKDDVPLGIGQKVLVIAGNQARVVADYTVPVEPPPKPAPVATAPPPGPVAAAPLPPPESPDAPKVETGP